MLTHVDLFSGIGGFALAAQWARFRTVCFCEIDEFCQEVLKARFGALTDCACAGQLREKQLENSSKGKRRKGANDLIKENPLLIPDIRYFDGSRFRGATLLTGGVPCQPASVAGKRKGTADDRWLWPEAIRILDEVRPTWAIFENPCGILSLEQGVVFEDLLSQMEGEGYEVWPIIIPACAVNAPHRRDRVWICCHSSELGLSRVNGRGAREKPEDRHSQIKHTKNDAQVNELSSSDAETICPQGCELGQGQIQSGRNSWDILWIEVATRLCRVDDGLPRQVDRINRLKALGNAIVPSVAYEIIKGIAEIEMMVNPHELREEE
jgi:DNA (cytosine-5)-methyltransferase 1